MYSWKAQEDYEPLKPFLTTVRMIRLIYPRYDCFRCKQMIFIEIAQIISVQDARGRETAENNLNQNPRWRTGPITHARGCHIIISVEAKKRGEIFVQSYSFLFAWWSMLRLMFLLPPFAPEWIMVMRCKFTTLCSCFLFLQHLRYN